MKRGKKAQLQIPFSMIFSIILIIAFIAVAGYAIMKFIDMKKCTEIGIFKQDLQGTIDRAWTSDGTSETFSSSLPSGIEKMCFVDFSESSTGKNKAYYEEAQLYIEENQNMFLWPLEKSCSGLESFEIEHIDVEKITSKENPYCVENLKGKVEMKIEKGIYDALVCIGECESGSTTTWTSTKTITEEEFSQGYREEVEEEQRFKVFIEQKEHYVGIISLTSTTVTIEVFSQRQKAILSIRETKKFDVTGDGYYDIQVTLNKIVNNKAELIIKKIRERIESQITGPGDFCGFSTLASCISDTDCKEGGCSNQVCEGVDEGTITTCEWKDCYDYEKYSVSCKCIEGKCKWTEIGSGGGGVNEIEYRCPNVSYINCMPPINLDVNPYCEREYRKWIIQNCPNIRFAD